MNFQLYHHHHRLNFLINSAPLQGRVELKGASPVDKTACFLSKDCVVCVEYTDGVLEVQGQESTSFAKKVITKIESVLPVQGRKKIYFRPLYSKTLSASLEKMLKDNGWSLQTLMPWSFYGGNYNFFLKNRKELRKQIKKDARGFLFLGRFHDHKVYKIDKSLGTEYAVLHSDILSRDSLSPLNTIEYPSRLERLKSFEAAINCKVQIKTGVPEGMPSFTEMSNYKWLLQPHGVGPRHNIYETMCLGIPSVIEKTSYNPELFSMFPMFDFTGNENSKVKDLVFNEDFRKSLQEKMLDFFEAKMTPESISSDLLTKIQNLL